MNKKSNTINLITYIFDTFGKEALEKALPNIEIGFYENNVIKYMDERTERKYVSASCLYTQLIEAKRNDILAVFLTDENIKKINEKEYFDFNGREPERTENPFLTAVRKNNPEAIDAFTNSGLFFKDTKQVIQAFGCFTDTYCDFKTEKDFNLLFDALTININKQNPMIAERNAWIGVPTKISNNKIKKHEYMEREKLKNKEEYKFETILNNDKHELSLNNILTVMINRGAYDNMGFLLNKFPHFKPTEHHIFELVKHKQFERADNLMSKYKIGLYSSEEIKREVFAKEYIDSIQGDYTYRSGSQNALINNEKKVTSLNSKAASFFEGIFKYAINTPEGQKNVLKRDTKENNFLTYLFIAAMQSNNKKIIDLTSKNPKIINEKLCGSNYYETFIYNSDKSGTPLVAIDNFYNSIKGDEFDNFRTVASKSMAEHLANARASIKNQQGSGTEQKKSLILEIERAVVSFIGHENAEKIFVDAYHSADFIEFENNFLKENSKNKIVAKIKTL